MCKIFLSLVRIRSEVNTDMFCKKCGTTIDDDSIFCKVCGQNQNSPISQNSDSKDSEDENLSTEERDAEEVEEDSFTSGCGCIVAVVVAIICLVFAIALSISFFRDDTDGNSPFTEIFSREANNSDIVVDSELNLSDFAVDLVILPKEDIDDLELTLSFYDKKGNLLKKTVKHIGDVESGKEVRKSIYIQEFSLTEIFQVSSVSASVTGGTV